MKALAGEGLRFLAFGAFNTLLTYALYCLLVFIMHPQLAYLLVYALGIVLAWAGNSRFVFRQPLAASMAAVYPFAYLVQYLATAGVVHLLMDLAALGPRVALLVALAIVTPLSFAWNRALLARRQP